MSKKFKVKRLFLSCLVVIALLFSTAIKEKDRDLENVQQLLREADRLRLEYNQQSIQLVEKAWQIAEKSSNAELKALALLKLAHLKNVFGDYQEALDYAQQGLAVASVSAEIEAALLNKIGFAHYRLGQYELALKNLNKSLQLSREAKAVQPESEALINIGLINWKIGNFQESLQVLFAALEKIESAGLKEEKARCLISIGNVYLERKELSDAENFFQRGLQLAEREKIFRLQGIALGNLGYLKFLEKEFDVANRFYSQVLKIWQKTAEKTYLGNTFFYLAKIWIEKREPGRARYYLNEARKIKTALNEEWDLIRIRLAEAEILQLERNYHEAEKLIKQCYLDAERMKARPLQKEILQQWVNFYEVTGNFRVAYEKLYALMKLKEELDSQENQKRIAELQEYYRTLSQQREILFLKNEDRLKELEIFRQKKLRSYVTSGLILMTLLTLALVLVVLSRLKANRRLKRALSEVKELSGLLPICAWCKKVRNDRGYWEQVETYLTDHSRLEFTHGICPECRESMKSQSSTGES